MRLLVAAWMCAALSAPAFAEAFGDIYTVGCKGTFGPDATEASLAATFGGANVRTIQVGYQSDESYRNETFLFPRGGAAEAHIVWAYRFVPSRPIDVTVYGGDLDFKTRTKASPRTWRSASGVRLMMPLSQLEELNGRPFKIVGGSTKGYASVSSWEGGKLARDPDGCRLDVNLIFFDLPKDAAWGEGACPVCPEVSSADPRIRGYGGHVYSFTVRRPSGPGR